MSHDAYSAQWHQAQQQVVELLQVELPPVDPPPEFDRNAVMHMLGTRFIKYIRIFSKLEESYDQIVHPQKRRVIRHVLDGVMGRILELKHEMLNFELSEYHYFDDILSVLKLTPDDVKIPVPKYFVLERQKPLKEREKLLAQVLAKLQLDEMQEEAEAVMSTEDAVQLIQRHERARQGRLRAQFMRELKMQEERERKHGQAKKMGKNEAALMIQKVFKKYLVCQRVRKWRHEEAVFLQMELPSDSQSSVFFETKNLLEERAEDRRIVREKHEGAYRQALLNIKEKIREQEGFSIRERLEDQIRQWFIECRDATGRFPDYPDDSEGGSELLFKKKDPAELQADLDDLDNKKDKKGKKPEKKEVKKDKKKDKKKVDEGFMLKKSDFLPTVNDGSIEYKDVWYGRSEEMNFRQEHDAQLIYEEKRKEIEEEIRLQVDELMREELTNLKWAIDRDKSKRKKKKKKKKKKGRKKKKEKDLTPDRPIESLYEEMIEQKIIKKPDPVTLTDYIGDFSYLGTSLRQVNIEPMPSLWDVKNLVTLYGILPLGSEEIHKKAPLVKSILLAGPHGTGKKMLVHAMCNELGANLFELSPENIFDKYPGKDGLKMLMHLVSKVGRNLQPTVILINNCDKIFMKKVPKTDKTDPKRLKKVLPKFLKTIKGDDRLVVVGTTSTPYNAQVKPLCKAFERAILIPRPDYASRYKLWNELIKNHGGVVGDKLDLSSLAKISDGYTPGQMITAIEEVLTERRLEKMKKEELEGKEFIPPLSKMDPVYANEEEALRKWFGKTPLGKKRERAANAQLSDKKTKKAKR
ncbi:hypothetical protein SNEBB_001676 [Seison nebaliae]|nr:hypothetical protein SNEBB_001676 [Seison nebaliae]